MIYYIITNAYFNDRDKERFGVEFFLNKGIKVKVIDVQDYTNPELFKSVKPIYKNENNLEVIVCANFEDVKNAISSNEDSFAILSLSDNYQSVKIRRLLKVKNIKRGILHCGMIPSVKNNIGFFSKIKHKIQKQGFSNFAKLALERFYGRFFDCKNYDFLITSNYVTSNTNYGNTTSKTILETHCLDYDLVLKNKYKLRLIDKKYVVFLDQYLVNHPDFIRQKRKLKISVDEYYDQLNVLFDKIENQFGFSVVIAAHPRANIDDYDVLFKNRKIINGNTALLVRDCEFCITHYSTAVNFAVIYNKPIVFITSNQLIKEDIDKYIQLFSSILGQSQINLSLSYELPQVFDVNEELFQNYKLKYIKKNHIEMTIWEMFYEQYLLKEFN
jgi:hypothetical protein